MYMLNIIKRLFSRKAKPDGLNEIEILKHVHRAFAGELPIHQEINSTGHGAVLTIEPTPGHKIVVGTVRYGKSRQKG